MEKLKIDKPDAVFLYVPVIEDICIEFGIKDAETITCMYEVFKRITDRDKIVMDQEAYDDGYEAGFNDAIEKAESMVDGLSWDIGRLKKGL